jgi:hypothetical protein
VLTKASELFWNIPCQIVFQTLKENLYVPLVSRGLNWSLPFHISIDASDTTLGAILGQK